MFNKKDKNDRGDFEEVNFEAESERWFKEKFLRLAISMIFVKTEFYFFWEHLY